MATGKHKRKRSKKLAFWKKHPELKRISAHLGKMIDNEKLTDLIAGLGCLIAGGLTAYNLGSRDPAQILGASLSGLVAYKLATSQNLIAGASGTAYLGALGLINFVNPLGIVLKMEERNLPGAKPEPYTIPSLWKGWFEPYQPYIAYPFG